MNRIRSISPENNLAICEAGVILANLHEAAQAVDRRFPLSLGAKGSATIGGLVSTNAGGTQVLRHGTMRALVDGIEAVLPDGSVHHGLDAQIGRAWGRGRVCEYVTISVVAVSLKKKRRSKRTCKQCK